MEAKRKVLKSDPSTVFGSIGCLETELHQELHRVQKRIRELNAGLDAIYEIVPGSAEDSAEEGEPGGSRGSSTETLVSALDSLGSEVRSIRWQLDPLLDHASNRIIGIETALVGFSRIEEMKRKTKVDDE